MKGVTVGRRSARIKSGGHCETKARRAISENREACGRAGASSNSKTTHPGTTRDLLAKALQQPENSIEERQAFSLYLKALHDVHAK